MSSTLAEIQAATRAAPVHLEDVAITNTSSTTDLSDYLGQYLIFQVDVDAHIDFGADATTSSLKITATQPGEFVITPGRTSMRARTASGSGTINVISVG